MKKTIILTDGIIKKYICSLREQERSAQCCAEPFLRHLLRNGGFRSRGGERYLAVPFGGADSGTPRAPQGLLRAQTLPEVHQP